MIQEGHGSQNTADEVFFTDADEAAILLKASNGISSLMVAKMKTNVLTLVLVLLVIIFVGVHFGSLPWTPTRIAGVVIGLPSLALLVLARLQLGGSFSVRPKAQALVTHGLYSRIRNPIYVFGALAIAGIFLYMNQPLYLWLFVVLMPLQIYRARQEGKVLEARFGEEYRQYRSRTWF
jgi:protein-S-isoprenylcysteine O-methyltransferase Ste14